MSLDISNLTPQEMAQLLEYSEDQSNIIQRYIVACQIITNLLEEDLKKELNFDDFDDSVDLTICKMLLDGDVIVEENERMLH